MWILAQNASAKTPSNIPILIIIGLSIIVLIFFIPWVRRKDHKRKERIKNLQKRLQAKGEPSQLEKKWALATESSVIKSATKNRGNYSPEIQSIIDEEAKERGLWEYVLYLRGEKPKQTVTPEGMLEGFVCEGCKGTRLNPATGRCVKCNLPPEDFGYCKKCDNFWSILPGEPCPECGTELGRYKAAMALRRLGNFLLDYLILMVIIFISAILLPPLGVFLGLFGFFLYYVIFETLWQRTLGKFITGTKVVTATGSKPTFDAIGIRTLARYVPFEPLSVWSERVLGWHDRWTGTYVIKASRFGGKETTVDQLESSFVSELLQKETCGTAKTAFVLSFIPFVNIIAPIFAFIALSKIKKSREALLGRGLAIASIVMSFLLAIVLAMPLVSSATVGRTLQQTRVTTTKANLKALHAAVNQFKMDTGRCPTEEEGLEVLIKEHSIPEKTSALEKTIAAEKLVDSNQPSPIVSEPIRNEELSVTSVTGVSLSNFRYPESKELPKDGWGRDFIYRVNPESGEPFVIISRGADGKEGGEGYNADLLSTDKEATPFTPALPPSVPAPSKYPRRSK